MTRVTHWTLVVLFLLGCNWASLSAQEITKDPLAEPEQSSRTRKTSERKPGTRTKNPLAEGEGKEAAPQEVKKPPAQEPAAEAQTGAKPEGQAAAKEEAKPPIEAKGQPSAEEQTRNPLAGTASRAEIRQTHLERDAPKNFIKDQYKIWTSPAEIRVRDSLWLVPFLGATAGFVATDKAAVSGLPTDPSTVNRYKSISDYGLYGTIGFSGALYLSGLAGNRPHEREAGWLAGEAVIDGFVVDTVIQQVTRRERPNASSHPQQWFQSSGSAFPSNHSMATWAAAAVLAREYPGLWTNALLYGAAGTVASMRVLAQQHSPSDVVVGSAVGYLIGRQVYKAHHNPDLAGASIGTVVKPGRETSGPRKLASPYVPMDSYVYPLLDQLIASGAARSGILGQRPWTRAECARLVEEASGNIKSESSPQRRIVNVLRREFADYVETESRPSRMIAIEELYTRALGISGTPLNDSFHFGQTLYNDYGRPYWEGFNNVTGISGSAVAGRFLMYGRGEYQHAPAVPGYSPAVAASLATIDQVNSLPRAAAGNPEANQFRLIEGYTGVQFSKLSFTVGKQSLWWGPVASGPWLFSNNAEPIYMGRFSLANPINLPWIFGYFGPFKFDTYFGKLAGHWYPRQPYTHGEKISFKPTPNLEFGFSRTMIIGGGHPLTPCPPVSGSTGCPGHPLTFGYFGNGFTTFSAGGNAGTSGDVGDNRGGFDFSYRVPKLRDWLTIYGDFFVDDDPSPLAAPRRTAINPGIYVAKLPFLHKLDFRAEAPMTAQSAISGSNGTFFYFNEGYRDGYTNKGFLLGNWVGRQAKGLYLSSRYMISPTANVQFLFRNQILDPNFITDGGTINDFRVTAEFTLRQHFKLAGFVQFERWNIPLLAAPPVTGPQHNVTTSVELKYLPNWRWRGD